MGFIGGALQERFTERVRGLDPGRLLAVPIDVGKHSGPVPPRSGARTWLPGPPAGESAYVSECPEQLRVGQQNSGMSRLRRSLPSSVPACRFDRPYGC